METKLIFSNSNGQKLAGILTSPTVNTPTPIVVMAHGFHSNKNSSTFTRLKELFLTRHIASFCFDFFGHGESAGKIEDVTIAEGADDITQAIRLVKKQGYQQIGLIGSSFGGICSLIAAAKSLDLKFLVLKSPVADFAAAKKITIPTLIVHGNQDEEVPVSQSRQLVQTLQNGTLIEIKGADHRYSGKGQMEQLISAIDDFVSKQFS
ncbi:hypothetical protein A3F03_03260 [Candidatus Roizmanbacteria bacterium RIFCSPHIGHO2_12_FULL_41_11]|uniref:Palmitoyl-protein thioesterase ABHD10, mitochondrial n=1 Tax=Candidatus Roizmanbacteria bacterium RIFCSPHIGHO2_12_FULL_41_11 TaxID=1802052 RepID=A0A1F7I548_9BACT|nr:MAG: hypothetical protein A3F03_03260 [Candidatus Roizmanbacteria bacterium RIFCSPHIGHO2_12_FULL_41_11]